jgi:argininosuccinate lyase
MNSNIIFKAESKLWGGRFKSGLDPLMEDFNNSLKFDKRLFSADITGSIAYAKALQKCNLITGINFKMF